MFAANKAIWSQMDQLKLWHIDRTTNFRSRRRFLEVTTTTEQERGVIHTEDMEKQKHLYFSLSIIWTPDILHVMFQ